jgi:hypothetical protein
VRLEPLYRATFTTPEAWGVELIGPAGTEGQSFLIAEGRADGRLSARLRGANYPRRRIDNTLVPEFHGVLETDDGAALLFAWHGYARAGDRGTREVVGSITHLSDDERYLWLRARLGVRACVTTRGRGWSSLARWCVAGQAVEADGADVHVAWSVRCCLDRQRERVVGQLA